MLEQPLAGGVEQQTGEAATAAGTDHHDVVRMTGLGERLHCAAGHNRFADLEVGVCRADGFQTRVEHIFELLLLCRVVEIGVARHHGDHVQLGAPVRGEIRGDLQCAQAPLRVIGPNGYLGDHIVEMQQIVFVVGGTYEMPMARMACACVYKMLGE